MSAPTVRAHYEALGQVRQQFSQQTDSTRQTLEKLKRAMQALQGGDWIGQGANQFYAEMNSSVVPTMLRLVNALDSAATTTQAISRVMKEAEDEAARVFSLQGGAAVATAAAAAGVGGVGAGLGGVGAAGFAAGAAVAGAGAAGAGAAATAANESVLDGTVSVKTAPKTVTLPNAFNKGMQDAWKDSFPGGHEQEQGGLLVKNPDGSHEWIRGEAGTGGTWTPNYDDLGNKQTYLGLGHTHPYDSGDVDVPYSDADVSFLFEPADGHQAEIMTVQSGKTQFLLGRTEEFTKAMAGKSQAEVDTTIADMKKLYADTVAEQKKAGVGFAERYQAAVKAVADKYNLVYYKGQDGKLARQ